MKKMLGEKFFNRAALTVAHDLIGKYLVRKRSGKEIAIIITETEAYGDERDLASHARSGKTPRNFPMYGAPAVAYVYLTYGMHWMLNIVCEENGYPAAVLIRGAGDVVGPARLTKFLHVNKRLNTMPLGKKNELWIEDRGVVIPSKEIQKTPRIGIDYAGKWALKPWRFVIDKKKTVRT